MANSTTGLRVGVGRCDITPAPGTPQGGWGAQTHQRGLEADMPMYASAIVLDRNGSQVLILDVDAIGFGAEWTGKILAAVEELTGIPRTNIRFSCTHTHAGPNTFRLENILEGRDMAQSYLVSLPMRIAGAAWRAMQSMLETRVGVGTGVSCINRNRRVIAPDGECIVGVNDSVEADHSVGAIRFDREDGTCLATIVHYACHPTTCGWQNIRFTPDFPGPMRQTVEQELGGMCFFLQGTAGDLGPRKGFTGDLGVYRRLGHELGLAAASVLAEIETCPEQATYKATVPSGANIAEYSYASRVQSPVSIAMISRDVALPTRTLEPEAEIADKLNQLRAEAQRFRDEGDLEQMRRVQAQATQMGWRLENARLYSSVTHVAWPVQVIRVGDIALVSTAGEPFSSISERIRKESPFPFTFVSGYSNGGFGYIPDRRAYAEGGYEVAATPFSPDAADVLVQECLRMLQELVER
ncbi:MAG: neutral/alkaline non-lysosomal ceramidase N-terminal domain-containing protein [Terriglobus sp.]